jgi:glycosyltransferase involved in cell wall biosynthesis
MSSRVSSSSRVRVAFFNPIFAHYRGALLRELLSSETADYALFADTHDPASGIPSADIHGDERFHRAPMMRLPAGLTWQSGVLRETLFGRYDTYILLGDAKWLSSWIGAIAARVRGKRVLFWTHGWNRCEHGMKRRLRSLFYRLGNGLLLYGERARQIGKANGFDPGRLYVMYNSLDFEFQQALRVSVSEADSLALRRKLFGSEDTPVVLATARLTPTKQFHLLIAAAKKLADAATPVNVLIVGDGPERERLQDQAERAGVCVKLVGACYDELQLARYFACANVTVMPGEIGLTCMHSLTYGTPVITHDDPDEQGPEWEAIVPGQTGALFRKGSIDDLAHAIAQWTRTVLPTDFVRERCIAAIRDRYHPAVQCRLIEAAITDGRMVAVA